MQKQKTAFKGPFPLKQPFIVAHTWAIAAWCAVLFFFPMLFPLAYIVHWIREASLYYFGISLQIPPALSMGLTMVVTLLPVFYLAGSKTSRYIVKTVLHHVEDGNHESAEKAALMVDYQVWFREFRKNEWFRQFLQDQVLYDKSARYRKFSGRLKRREKWTIF